MVAFPDFMIAEAPEVDILPAAHEVTESNMVVRHGGAIWGFDIPTNSWTFIQNVEQENNWTLGLPDRNRHVFVDLGNPNGDRTIAGDVWLNTDANDMHVLGNLNIGPATPADHVLINDGDGGPHWAPLHAGQYIDGTPMINAGAGLVRVEDTIEIDDQYIARNVQDAMEELGRETTNRIAELEAEVARMGRIISALQDRAFTTVLNEPVTIMETPNAP